ncbi:hypothetical protein [Blastococcus brunescens]|uniref:Uncharacterized protein n=1 Tax=Blastococcus brunescens TaxID=1564165 RepID=A0ABZ1BAT4_9ACTN|nr:hypothetical protein [Blastococcus sp. BMG 8361]WRL66340.1 hypothetical protein U6N30_13400 [Blastococcus sp. BMG 8361]
MSEQIPKAEDPAPISWEALAAELAATRELAQHRGEDDPKAWDAVAAELAVRVAEQPVETPEPAPVPPEPDEPTESEPPQDSTPPDVPVGSRSRASRPRTSWSCSTRRNSTEASRPCCS